jgi:hypothetical protein
MHPSAAQFPRQDDTDRPPRGRGRPTRFTAETRETLLTSLAAGATRKDACAIVGLGYSTFMSWMQQGAAGDGEYGDFALRVKQVEATFVVTLCHLWTRATRTDWRAAMALLERRYREAIPTKVIEHRYHPLGTPPVGKVYELYGDPANYRAMFRAAKAGDDAEFVRLGGKIRMAGEGNGTQW